MYPSRTDLESWVELGNKGWGPDEMAPYLRKFHTYTPPTRETAELLSTDEYMKAENQGTNGPVPVTLPDIYNNFSRAWDDTFAKLGWKINADPIDGKKMGAFTSPLSVNSKGQRGYATAYYTAEVAQRRNLLVQTETMVEKILFDKKHEKPRATGVQVRGLRGDIQRITARCEVILCAGVINSPQLLELSGIGQADILRKHGIPLVHESPGVGENLQDHAMVTLGFEVAEGQVSGDAVRGPEILNELIRQYDSTGTGPLAGIQTSAAYLPAVDGQGKLSKEAIQELLARHSQDTSAQRQCQYDILNQMLLDNKAPHGQYIFGAQQHHTNPGVTTTQDLMEKKSPKDYISIFVLLNRPYSRGSVHIRSRQISNKPVYDPNMLSHPLDLELLARQTQFVDRLVSTEPFSSLLKPSSRIPEHSTGFDDLDATKETVKDQLFTCFQPTGTCAMMPADMNGVVDPCLKVHGVTNLRVVDASVFPMEPAGGSQAITYAVAERAADLIKEERHYPS